MQPDQPQYSIDYLNQIAPQEPKRGLSNKAFLLLVGGLAIVAIIIGFLVFNNGTSDGTKLQTLAARISELQKITHTAGENISSNKLQSINSNLDVLLTDANRSFAEPLAKHGIKSDRLDKNIVAKESSEELAATLEDARLNAVYDRVYTREMSYQLSRIFALAKEIYTTTNSKPTKDFLTKMENDMEQIRKQLAQFNESPS